MRVRSVLSGKTFDAILSTEHAAASYGRPVLVVDGEPLGPFEAAALELVEATPEERAALRAAGYALAHARA